MLMLTAIAATPSSPANLIIAILKKIVTIPEESSVSISPAPVEAGLDKVPFVPVEFGKFQVCFVEFKINQTHQRGDGDRGDRRDRGAENTPA